MPSSSTNHLLPTTEEQAWLLDHLSELVERQGFESLVAAPIVEPTKRFFPDRWEANVRGVWRLARRLLWYAGLEELDVNVIVYDDEAELVEASSGGHHDSWVHRGAAAWFAGIEDGVCVFGASKRHLAQPESIVGVMAHEVAHAYRAYHGLVCEDRDLEERLTDLTTIYLGFGLLTTNNAYRYRASGGFDGTMVVTRWQHTQLGYLPAVAMSFLLAAVVEARGFSRRERGHIRRQLETNQAAFFKAACKALDRDELKMRILLPDRSAWPTRAAIPRPEDLGPYVEGPSADPEQTNEAEVEKPARGLFNHGRPVFRVIANAAFPYSVVGFAAGSAVGLLLAVTGLPVLALTSSILAGVFGGYLWGRSEPRDYCSDPACAGALSSGETTCPACGGTVMGTIEHPDDRLDAEERLEQMRIPPRRPRDPPPARQLTER